MKNINLYIIKNIIQNLINIYFITYNQFLQPDCSQIFTSVERKVVKKNLPCFLFLNNILFIEICVFRDILRLDESTPLWKTNKALRKRKKRARE